MLQKNTLEHYFQKFQKLRQGGTPYGKAPHKPILLLSVLHQIEQGRVTDNRLYLTPEWVSDFVMLFKTLVQTGNRLEFSLPFYHLPPSTISSGIWTIGLKNKRCVHQEGQP